MLNFQKDFPKAVMIQLAENYRSTECIIKGAGRVIAHNTNRFQKSTHGIRGNGEKITISFFQNQAMEALAVVKKVQDMLRDGREPQEIAVLFRTNTGARIYLEKFMEYNLPFRMRDGLPNIYEHWIRKRSVYLHTHCKRKSQPERFSADHKPSEPLYQP